jgi:ABC-type polysaccharide/polyol phosphate export permease
MADVIAPRAVAEEPPPLVAPSATTGMFEVFRRRYLLKLLVRREIQARYSGSFLGLIWSYINPLSQFFIYYFVIGILIGLHQNVPNFAIHMFCGIILVHFFNETFNAGTRSIVRNRGVVQKMAVPREMFPVASMLVSAFHIVPQMVILVVACLVTGWAPDPVGMVSALSAVLIVGTIATALALVFSVANVYMRDMSNVVNVLTNFVRFGVPMIYPYSMVDERFHGHTDWFLANPLAIAVLQFQRGFWIGTTPDPVAWAVTDLPPNLLERGLIALLVGVIMLVLAQVIFTRFDSRIPERL